jgi:hypothetical protein
MHPQAKSLHEEGRNLNGYEVHLCHIDAKVNVLLCESEHTRYS